MSLTGTKLVRCLCLALLTAVAIQGMAVETDAAPAESQVLSAGLANAEPAIRAEALDRIVASGDVRWGPVLEAWANGLLRQDGERLVIYLPRVDLPGAGKAYPVVDAFTGELIGHESGLARDMLRARPPERRAARTGLLRLSLEDPVTSRRVEAIIGMADRRTVEVLPLLLEMAQRPNLDALVVRAVSESIARLRLADPASTEVERLAAIRHLGELAAVRGEAVLQALAADTTQSRAVRTQSRRALVKIDQRRSITNGMSHIFSGLSAASILILLALGLSITFGLMGVINMAHGEMMMIGAFTTWGVSNLFASWLPAWHGLYIVVAIPAAFVVSAGVGMIIESTVIRHLYRRPLETLLATFGVSLILIQAVRVLFGDKMSLPVPTWLSGSTSLADDISLPNTRLFIIGYCALTIVVVVLVLTKTKLGLLIRATSQARSTAASLGVNTRMVDSLTFGLGSGLAGLAGVVVPFIGILNPQMGESYIVDSFLVVVGGGVGNLAGVVVAGLGLGMATKLIEPLLEAVFTKVFVLGAIIVFLQARPSGLFPAKGRLADV